MNILGISAFYHDSAAALVRDGEIVAAAQEERFTRNKGDAAYPRNAVAFCLDQGRLTLGDVDHVVFYDKPLLKFERLLETYVGVAPRGFRSFRAAMPVWLKEKLFQKDLLRKELKKTAPEVAWDERLLFAEHHQSHAASAFYPSPFEEAVILTLDGVGEWATTSVGLGRGRQIRLDHEIHFPHSLGLLYSAFTYYLGFKVNSGEYKVMGLAPYGQPRYTDQIYENLIDLKDDGSFRLDMRYFDYCTDLKMIGRDFAGLFGREARDPDTVPLDQFHMDVAASIQAVTETVMLRMARSLARTYDIPNLCLAGGVALNSVGNGKVLRDGAFERIWIQPAAGDAGGALGAALSAWHEHLDQPRPTPRDTMRGGFLGPAFDTCDVAARLEAVGAVFRHVDDGELTAETARALADGFAVGWFQGAMEFGPRALGARSILGDPRRADTQRTLNVKVKYRESFRPFAPSVLAEHAPAWFDLNNESPYMLIVAPVREGRRREMTEAERNLFGIDQLNVVRSDVPAVTHVDYSARVQTVTREACPRYAEMIEQFHALTGCPMVVNTSFNVRGEPIVRTPEEALRCFMGTDLDMLVIENCILRKQDQPTHLVNSYSENLERD